MTGRSPEGLEYDRLSHQARSRARQRLVDLHRDEYNSILEEEWKRLGLDQRSPLPNGRRPVAGPVALRHNDGKEAPDGSS